MKELREEPLELTNKLHRPNSNTISLFFSKYRTQVRYKYREPMFTCTPLEVKKIFHLVFESTSPYWSKNQKDK